MFLATKIRFVTRSTARNLPQSRQLMLPMTSHPIRNFFGGGRQQGPDPNDFDVEKDYYKYMELDKKVDAKTIKMQYHKLCFQYHPDKASGMYQEKFKLVNEAYAILKDEAKRKDYDDAR